MAIARGFISFDARSLSQRRTRPEMVSDWPPTRSSFFKSMGIADRLSVCFMVTGWSNNGKVEPSINGTFRKYAIIVRRPTVFDYVRSLSLHLPIHQPVERLLPFYHKGLL